MARDAARLANVTVRSRMLSFGIGSYTPAYDTISCSTDLDAYVWFVVALLVRIIDHRPPPPPPPMEASDSFSV